MSEEFVTVGRLGKTRGVHGEIWIVAETDFPDRFLQMTELYLRYKDHWEKLAIDSARLVSGRPVVKLEGFDNPEDAARLTNREIGVPKDQVVELPEGSFYIYDLIGCRVVDNDSDTVIGEIVNVETYPANDVYVIETAGGKKVSIAAVKEFIRDIDLAGKTVRIIAAGLLEQ
ncbi:MAG: ribosome maturation factor RimM [Candidatus Zixiibacteriota bacterium]